MTDRSYANRKRKRQEAEVRQWRHESLKAANPTIDFSDGRKKREGEA